MAKEAKKAAPKKAAEKEVKFAVSLADMAKRLNMTEVSLRDKCRRLDVPKHSSGKYGWTSKADADKAESILKAGARGAKEKPAKKVPAKKAAPKKVNAKKPVAEGANAA